MAILLHYLTLQKTGREPVDVPDRPRPALNYLNGLYQSHTRGGSFSRSKERWPASRSLNAASAAVNCPASAPTMASSSVPSGSSAGIPAAASAGGGRDTGAAARRDGGRRHRRRRCRTVDGGAGRVQGAAGRPPLLRARERSAPGMRLI